MSNFLQPHLCGPLVASIHGILQARVLKWIAILFSRESSQLRDRTQGSNPGLLHCRQILYRLSHQGFLETFVIYKVSAWEKAVIAIG